jgi:HD-GYP domain-containing protein (c-di-GMP phosphodiesterase class II)
LRLGQGFAGQVALEQRVVHVSNLDEMQSGFSHSPEFRSERFVSYIGIPLIAKGNIIGVLEIYHRRPLEPGVEWMAFLDTLAGQAAIAIDNIRLFEDLQSSNLQLRQAYDATIEGWAQALELRDSETEGHSRRAVELTMELARKMGIQESQLAHIRRGALLHDIGKMGVPDSILLKNGPLSDNEWETVREHTTFAYKWLAPILYLQPALDIPYCHHEKWDGTGYPRGLKGEQIPLAARIFTVVDVWDALRSDRPYRDAWSREKALAYLREESGKQFDPQVVKYFIELLSELENTARP